MLSMIESAFVFLFCCFLSLSALAKGHDVSIFSYDGKLLAIPLGKGGGSSLFSAWNAKPSPDDRRLFDPGIQVLFWGRGDGCDVAFSNGPVSSDPVWVFSGALNKTGIPLEENKKDLRWTPVAAGSCSSDSKGKAGPSFVHVNEEAFRGGIGIYTSSGKEDSDGSGKGFFRQFDERGQNGIGANKYIAGTFVAFRFDSKASDQRFVLNPFDGGASRSSNMIIEMVQNVATIHVPVGPDPKTKSPNQVKQQFAVTLVNKFCLSHREAGSLCQIKYLFHTAIVREGVTDWNRELWFDKASLLLDPAQGGVPVFHGPIKSAGADTVYRENSAVPLWTSQGSPTLHRAFEPTDFRVQISIRQLLDATRIAAARMKRVKYEAVSSQDIADIFGDKWNDQDEWFLLDLNFAQEVHNTDLRQEAWIGGGVKSISIFRQ